MMRWSGGGSRASSCSIAGRKSSATVQQMQPLASSMIEPSVQTGSPQFFAISPRISPSTPTSPNSLMISARRRPAALARIWRISVVLPAPRNPVTMVAGIRDGRARERSFIKPRSRCGGAPDCGAPRRAGSFAGGGRRHRSRPERPAGLILDRTAGFLARGSASRAAFPGVQELPVAFRHATTRLQLRGQLWICASFARARHIPIYPSTRGTVTRRRLDRTGAVSIRAYWKHASMVLVPVGRLVLVVGRALAAERAVGARPQIDVDGLEGST